MFVGAVSCVHRYLLLHSVNQYLSVHSEGSDLLNAAGNTKLQN